MNGARAFKVMGMAALILTAQVGAAASCGFDSGLGNTFTPMHPKSLGVAFAVRDAVTSGTIEAATDPASAGQAGYWRAVGQLTSLQRALSAAHAEGRMAVSVLFIDSGLWARLTPSADGLAMDVHTEGAKDGDVVIVTNEPVLTAVLERRLPVADALQRGLIAVDGEAVTTEAMRRLIAVALTAPVVSARFPQDVRLFGPVRK
ncbi:hypothetical protein ACFIOY_30790 [Bradyrhizobium sp. TZ2]